jgi:Uri superfamily endonuclease
LSGYYANAGRARKGLDARIARHMKKRKVCRWHIDYLTAAEGVRVLEVVVHGHDAEKECEINRLLSGLPSARIYAPGFGASDCKQGCGSHLIYFSERPSIDLLQIPDSSVNMEAVHKYPTVKRSVDRNA